MIQPLWGNNRWGANGNSEVRIREDSVRREKVAKVTAWISLSVTSWLESYHTGPSSEQLRESGWNCLYAVLFPSKYIYAKSMGLCVSVCLCTCVCGYPCVYMHICMSLYPYVHICVSLSIYSCICAGVCACPHLCMPVCSISSDLTSSWFFWMSPFLHFSSCNSNSVFQQECHSSAYNTFMDLHLLKHLLTEHVVYLQLTHLPSFIKTLLLPQRSCSDVISIISLDKHSGVFPALLSRMSWHSPLLASCKVFYYKNHCCLLWWCTYKFVFVTVYTVGSFKTATRSWISGLADLATFTWNIIVWNKRKK